MKHIALFLPLVILSCSPKIIQSDDPYFQGSHECAHSEKTRIGCQCKDGTYSKAKGSGACSGHGGVGIWLCKNEN